MENVQNLSLLNTVAEVELIYKTTVKPSQRPQLKTSQDCYELLKLTWDENKIKFVEQFKVILLNKAQRVLEIYEMSSGGVSGTVADPRLIFIAALKTNTVNVVLAHNHPSGNLRPSKSDEELTHKIKQGGILLEIKVIDHIIISSEGYFSFADEGYM